MNPHVWIHTFREGIPSPYTHHYRNARAGHRRAAARPRQTAADASPAPPAIVAPGVARQLRINIAWQIALDAQDFSPGIIDGVFKAQGADGLERICRPLFSGASPFDIKVFQSLQVDVDGALTNYTITPDDAAQVGGPLPEDWNEKSQLKRLNYESLADCIAEKFHCSQGMLETLNPGLKLDQLSPDQTLVVPNIRPFPQDNRVVLPKRSGADSVTVNLAEKTIRVFDKDGNELALFIARSPRTRTNSPTATPRSPRSPHRIPITPSTPRSGRRSTMSRASSPSRRARIPLAWHGPASTCPATASTAPPSPS